MRNDAEGPSHDARRWLPAAAAALLFLAVTALLVATSNPGRALVNDTRAGALASWSLGTHGEAALPEPWPASHNYWGVEGRDGRVYVNRFPGVAYWAAPAYAAAALSGSEHVSPAHPFLVDVRPAGWTAAVTVVLAGLVAVLLLRRLLPDRWALLAGLVLVTGTGLWSVAADALWPHGPTALVLLTALLGWRRDQTTLVAAAAAGSVLVRPHLAVALVVLAVYAWRWNRDGRGAAAFAGGTLAGLAALSA